VVFGGNGFGVLCNIYFGHWAPRYSWSRVQVAKTTQVV